MSVLWDFENYKENEVEYLEGVHPELGMKIVSIKHHFSKEDKKAFNKSGKYSPFTNVCFKVMGGEHKDKLLNERFYCAAKFKMAWLAIACGIYDEVDGKKIVPSTFKDPMVLAKRELYISTKTKVWEGKKYTEIDQMSSESLLVEPEEVDVNKEATVY